MKLDNWKDIKQPDSAQKVHQDNVRTREEGRRSEQQHNLKTALRNLKTPPAEKRPEAAADRAAQPKPLDGPSSARSLTRAKAAPLSQTPGTPGNRKSEVRSTNHESATTHHASYSSSSPSSAAPKNMPQTLAASHFVVETPRPNLTQILKSIPPAPPKAEDAKQEGKAKQAQADSEIPKTLQQAAAKVSAPLTPDGAKLADASKKEGEVGKKRSDAADKKGEGAATAAAHRGQRRTHDGGLEAASGGIAGESGEAVWIADKEPLGYTVNLDRDLSTIEEIRKRADWYRKYVEQPKVAEVLNRAVQVSKEVGRFLEEQVKKNIPAKNTYGVVRG